MATTRARREAVRRVPSRDDAFDLATAFDADAGALLGFCVNALGDRAQAEDVVQETFARAWRRRETYDPSRASRRTWLFAIARNLVLDELRARARRPHPVDEAPDRVAPAHVEDEVVARLQLLSGLAAMSREHREVVTAVHLEGETYASLSARTGTSVATLRSRMHYGLRAMRTSLDEMGWRDR